MKKIFVTTLTVILLTVAFVFYMKWFNAPLAELASNFVYKTEVVETNCEVISGVTLDENEVLVKLESLEEHMNTLEDLIEIQNAENTADQFEVTMPVEDVIEEPTEAELFEEFKIWRAENK